MRHTIKCFLKFGSNENMLDLYENGTVYMNPIQYFRDCHGEDFRGDPYEGAAEVINSLPGTFRIAGIDQEFHYEKLHLKKAYEEVLGNLYCLYAVSSHGWPDPFEFRLDEKNMKFGSHCLLVEDNSYFLQAVESQLQKLGHMYRHGFVEYYDKDKVCKELTLFDKPLEFEHQKEFRFYVENPVIEPIKIQIGSLEGKARIFTMEDIMSMRMEPSQKM